MTSSTHEVHLAIYDLSMGMARSLSAQFLGGPQHAIDIVPHTALLVYGKEFFFGRGIEWCTPSEFRESRGIHPIEMVRLGRTSRSAREFEDWCVEQGRNGRFSRESYDLLHRNCNNFSHEAALEGLNLPIGVPQWILDVPAKFLSSPMGMMMRPILEGMQLSNNAPTNLPIRGGSHSLAAGHSTVSSAFPRASEDVNPWANTSTTTSSNQSNNSIAAIGTPLLDKQTGPLLSTDTGVVQACIAKLVTKQDDLPHSLQTLTEEENTSKLLVKLADPKVVWTQRELQLVHQHLRFFVENGIHLSFALMLLRLAVLNHSPCDNPKVEEKASISLIVSLLLQDRNKMSVSNRSMAWCVLSNAIGSSSDTPSSIVSDYTDNENSEMFLQLIDRAVVDSSPIVEVSTSWNHVSLRQSAVAFLYNVTRKLADDSSGVSFSEGNKSTILEGANNELSEAIMAILIGSIENIKEETDDITLTRRYLCIGHLLKSPRFGKTVLGLVQDLGFSHSLLCSSNDALVGGCLAKEVTFLLNSDAIKS